MDSLCSRSAAASSSRSSRSYTSKTKSAAQSTRNRRRVRVPTARTTRVWQLFRPSERPSKRFLQSSCNCQLKPASVSPERRATSESANSTRRASTSVKSTSQASSEGRRRSFTHQFMLARHLLSANCWPRWTLSLRPWICSSPSHWTSQHALQTWADRVAEWCSMSETRLSTSERQWTDCLAGWWAVQCDGMVKGIGWYTSYLRAP